MSNEQDYYNKQCSIIRVFRDKKEQVEINTDFCHKVVGMKNYGLMTDREVFKNLLEDGVLDEKDFQLLPRLYHIKRTQEFRPWPKELSP